MYPQEETRAVGHAGKCPRALFAALLVSRSPVPDFYSSRGAKKHKAHSPKRMGFAGALPRSGDQPRR